MSTTPATAPSKPRLRQRYEDVAVPALMKQFGLKNRLQVPRLVKVVVNMGVGGAALEIKLMETATQDMAVITGQKPLVTRAKKSISNFKIREGQPVGCKVTMRGRRMYEFLDRLINVALPRIRDFQGISPKSFDEHGNYALGLKEQSVFPEIDVNKITRPQGMDIIIVTTTRNRDHSRALLKQLGMPFREETQSPTPAAAGTQGV